MRRIKLAIIMFFCVNTVFSQFVYYGIPTQNNFSDGDKIIMNVPPHIDGRFEQSYQLEELIQLLNSSPNYIFEIEINDFRGTEELCQKYSEALSRSLDGVFKVKSKYLNYQLFANGSTKPIFYSENKIEFFMLNRRLEIIIKEKNKKD
jgi:transcriptional regulator with XRE-family HTH domain